MEKQQFGGISAVLVFVFLLGAAGGPAVADDELRDAVERCSRILDEKGRVACYDKLARRQAAGTDAAAAPSSAEDPAARDRPPPAAEQRVPEPLRHKNRVAEEEKSTPDVFTARVTSCRKNVHDRYLFYLGNGEIWQQAKDDRLYFRECDFEVTITKDFFGYKMRQVGEKRRIRIKRVR